AVGDFFAIRALFFCHQGLVIPVRLYLCLVAVFLGFFELAAIREYCTDVALGVGHVNLRTLLGNLELIGRFDEVAQPCPLIVGACALAAPHSGTSARPAHSTHSDAGDSHRHSAASHPSASSHGAVLITILHRRA